MVATAIMLIVIGLMVGTFGTMIGAGGGFILMPIFLALFPDTPPERLTSLSLAIVFLNALSGSFAYARTRRIDYRSGILFSLAAVPGVVVGAIATSAIPRNVFDPVFGAVLVGVATYLFARTLPGSKAAPAPPPHRKARTLVDRDGHVHVIAYNLPLGLAISAGVGFVSSVLGIGGGIIHVPALVQVLGFPVHVATATSHFILAGMAGIGTLVHLVRGELSRDPYQILLLGPSVILGAQLGAALSRRIHGRWIMRSLALALTLVGVRIVILRLA